MHTTPLLAPRFELDSDQNGGAGFTVRCAGHPLDGIRLLFSREAIGTVLEKLGALRLTKGLVYYPKTEGAMVSFETRDIVEHRSSSYFTVKYLTVPGQPVIECDRDGMLAFERLLKRASGALLI